MRYQTALFTDDVLSWLNQDWEQCYRIQSKKERMGWLTRLELATTGITIRGSTNWAIATTDFYRCILRGNGTPERIRTFDLWLRRPTLYPTELRAHALSAEWNNTDITLCRLVLFLLFLSFGLFFDSYLPLNWIFDVIHALSWITCCLLQQVIGI